MIFTLDKTTLTRDNNFNWLSIDEQLAVKAELHRYTLGAKILANTIRVILCLWRLYDQGELRNYIQFIWTVNAFNTASTFIKLLRKKIITIIAMIVRK